MILQTYRRKSIASCVAIAVFSAYSMIVLASPSTRVASGELFVSGMVTMDGEKMSSGTFFSDSRLATADNGSATVNLSKLGRVKLAPSSGLKLSFTENSVIGFLDGGSAQVSTLAGISVSFTTTDGVVSVDGREATSFAVSVVDGVTSLTTHSGLARWHGESTVMHVTAGESATPARPQGTRQTRQRTEDMRGIGGGALAALLLAAGGAIAAAIIAANQDNDFKFDGVVIVISPTK